jgi:ribose-phosphate pyrophosphokinase
VKIKVFLFVHQWTPNYYLYFLAKTAKEFAKAFVLSLPYLAYMRQDKAFNRGESVTSTYFLNLISGFVDTLITIDPHPSKKLFVEIYSIPTTVSHAASSYFNLIKYTIDKPILIGPDSESEQWVLRSQNANAPM